MPADTWHQFMQLHAGVVVGLCTLFGICLEAWELIVPTCSCISTSSLCMGSNAMYDAAAHLVAACPDDSHVPLHSIKCPDWLLL